MKTKTDGTKNGDDLTYLNLLLEKNNSTYKIDKTGIYIQISSIEINGGLFIGPRVKIESPFILDGSLTLNRK